ncbi:nitroreductase family protein [Oceanospirillum sediminis]|uniref:Putative NAD(P)H nitroreductase n=1 Tax=Oceanospirillum sediminis TaxID=2760088 RepID=A0A839IR10_9GAMM|nr:nitroreductase [Oceanospirillum sediminis]MBB1487104.1 nitroreductase [Oceanospirillum sediminis]
MKTEDLLLQRNSHPKLGGEVPDPEIMEFLYQAALRAPDHGNLRPWQFVEFTGEGRDKLGQLFCDSLLSEQPDADEAAQRKRRNMPLRAPVVIAVIAKVVSDHPKVPVIEQVISAGTAAQNILLAAHAKGLGAMWRTGDVAFESTVAEGLGLSGDDVITGFIYLGEIEGRTKPVPEHNSDDFVQRWS